MIKIITIIGARPQIIKAAAISRTIQNKFSSSINEFILHTGQHYDDNMSKIFFDELNIPKPDFNLNVGSSVHGQQIANMISGIEQILIDQPPHAVILYGDTNSTLAGALAASRLYIPVIHIVAGLRSYNKTMPEEINRIVCDHSSTLLFSPTLTGIQNLIKEGFNTETKPPFNIDNPKIVHCGDVMYDNSMYYATKAGKNSQIIDVLELTTNRFLLVTIHRDNNTDNPDRLTAIFNAVNKIAQEEDLDVVIPMHPRTSGLLEKQVPPALYNSLMNNRRIRLIHPVSYFDMINLEKQSLLILTDSGGVQKEAYFFKKPCIIVRQETEWKEIIDNNAGIITDANEEKIINAYNTFIQNKKQISFPPVFGDGRASEFICREIVSLFSNN